MPGIAEDVSMTIKILSKLYTLHQEVQLWGPALVSHTQDPGFPPQYCEKLKKEEEGQEKEEVVEELFFMSH